MSFPVISNDFGVNVAVSLQMPFKSRRFSSDSCCCLLESMKLQIYWFTRMVWFLSTSIDLCFMFAEVEKGCQMIEVNRRQKSRHYLVSMEEKRKRLFTVNIC
jgi:hypothetical protein